MRVIETRCSRALETLFDLVCLPLSITDSPRRLFRMAGLVAFAVWVIVWLPLWTPVSLILVFGNMVERVWRGPS